MWVFALGLNVRVHILDPAALATSSQALRVFLAVWRRSGGKRYRRPNYIFTIFTKFRYYYIGPRAIVYIGFLE